LTDDDIAARLGKRPLEVGANLISRTSVAAVDLLGKIRSMTGEPIPLAWSWLVGLTKKSESGGCGEPMLESQRKGSHAGHR
jgi:hypothetical protein